MATGKYQAVTKLYSETVADVTAGADNWTSFLKSACRNYRLPFDEQILIYAQRPDATAVLEIGDWNSRFGRIVKRSARGIAVMDKRTDHVRLKYTLTCRTRRKDATAGF